MKTSSMSRLQFYTPHDSLQTSHPPWQLTLSAPGKASQVTPPSSESTMSDSDTSCSADSVRGSNKTSRTTPPSLDPPKSDSNTSPSADPAKGNMFHIHQGPDLDWNDVAILLFIFTFFLALMALTYLVVTSVYSFLLLGGARPSAVNMVNIPTAEPAIATVTTTETATVTQTVTASANRQDPTQTIGGPLILDPPPANTEGVPRSMGFWKHLAREMFYEECFRGCRYAKGGCSLSPEGDWEKACRQTDLLIRHGVDCSATNLMMGKGGNQIFSPDIPEACLDSLARQVKKMRIEDLQRRDVYRGRIPYDL